MSHSSSESALPFISRLCDARAGRDLWREVLNPSWDSFVLVLGCVCSRQDRGGACGKVAPLFMPPPSACVAHSNGLSGTRLLFLLGCCVSNGPHASQSGALIPGADDSGWPLTTPILAPQKRAFQRGHKSESFNGQEHEADIWTLSSLEGVYNLFQKGRPKTSGETGGMPHQQG